MREAHERRVTWPDVSVNTFVLLARYAYSDCLEIESVYPEATLEPKQGEETHAKKRSYDQMTTEVSSSGQPNIENFENHLSFYLSLARLYYLAEKYGVTRLNNHIINTLDGSLLDRKDYTRRAADIVALLEYVFSDENVPTQDGLREYLIDFTLDEITELEKHKDFALMLQSGGVLAKTLWPKVIANLGDSQKRVKELERDLKDGTSW